MFTKNHRLVQDYVLLIQVGKRTIEDVPDFQNLREVVQEILTA